MTSTIIILKSSWRLCGQRNMVSVEEWFQSFSLFRSPIFKNKTNKQTNKLGISFCRCPTKIPPFMPPFREKGFNCSQKRPCVGIISVCRESYFSSLFSQSQSRQILTPFQTQSSLYLKWTKEKPREKIETKPTRDSESKSLAYVYCIITILQTNVQQLHHQ